MISWEDLGPKLGEAKEASPWYLLSSPFWDFLGIPPVYPMEDTVGGDTGDSGVTVLNLGSRWFISPNYLSRFLDEASGIYLCLLCCKFWAPVPRKLLSQPTLGETAPGVPS